MTDRLVDIQYRAADGVADLQQILDLQLSNLERAVSADHIESDGFVTVQHDLELLTAMNDVQRHVVAVADGQVVGYALSMLPSFEQRIPILQPMCRMLEKLRAQGHPMLQGPFMIMGQICVAAAARGQGVPYGLYACMRQLYAPQYSSLITEVSRRNPRSSHVHQRVGFQLLQRYTDPDGEIWDLIGWDLNTQEPIES
ncbi:MAG: hypothetical protein DHS20C11_04340 [Lysobacteraceae bacterium]|nr:MAG: hypothetical protein DHS20C11_04340 [Xanthomonadaceae bacterium]